MTAVNFPDNPQPGDVFLNFVWDGEKWRNAGGRANAVVFKDLFEFSVAADDSTLKTVSTGESIKFTGASGITTSSDAEGNITITQGTTSSLVNSTKTVSLGSDGALTLPEGGRINAVGYNNIVRLGNDGFMVANGSIFNENETGLSINGQNSDAGTYIQIPGRTASENGEPLIISHQWENTSIDILGIGGIWSFDNDGSLLIPGKIRVDEGITRSNLTAYDQTSGYGGAGGPNALSIMQSDWPTANIDIPVGAEITSPTFNTATVTSPVIQGPTSTWIIPIGTTNATAFTSTIDISYVVNKTWTFGSDGDITFPDGTVQTTAPESFSFSVAGDDSTQRAISNNELIKFIGAGGITTASDGEGNITITGSSITVNGTSISLGSSATILAANPNALTIGTGLSGTNYTGASAVTIALASGYGDTQNPYASKTANNFLAAPNGSNGAPTFRAIVAADIPTLNQNTTGSAATLTTARNINGVSFNGSAAINIPTLTDGTNSIKITAAPQFLTGAAGDVVGSVAFDSTYIYYCFQEFTGTSYSLPVISGLGEFSERVDAGSSELRTAIVAAFAATPAGWSYGGYPVNNITAATGTSINIFRDYGSPIFNGFSYTLIQPSATANWKITPWGATTSAPAAGSLTGNTLASGVTASSLTSVGTLTSLSSGAITTTGTLAVNASGGITTNQTTFSLINTTATTVNFAGAAITLSVGAGTGTTTINNNLSMASGKTIGTTATVTSDHATAFSAGDSAISNVALSVPRNAAIRDRTNGASVIYFDVSNGGTTNGEFQFRSNSAFTNVLTMSPTGFNVNTNAVVTARTPSLARTAFNAAMGTELTVDNMRFRITNSGLAGIFPQVIGNGSARNLAWTVVAARSGSAVTQAGSTGTIVASDGWTTLYSLGGMDSSGDTFTATLQDKGAERIYRVTFMRSDAGGDGFNIIAERLL